MMVKIKVCGIKDEMILKKAINQGVDATGVVINVPSSPRAISIEDALQLKEEVPPFISFTAVILPNSVSDAELIVDKLKPDVLQVHAIKPLSFFKKLRRIVDVRLIFSLPIDANGNSRLFDRDPIAASRILEEYCDALLIDTYSPKAMGGSGRVHDWNVAKKVRNTIKKPLILSGGLNPNNVVDAISIVQPYAVDASSGLESSPGVKDPNLIEEFVKKIREAESHA
ncbi:MAG: phosphoribosylanthranilate isomerase [Candidatus Helarchaeales archaeon]